MSSNVIFDKYVISDLINRLSELDKKLADSGIGSNPAGSGHKSSFLFSFEIQGAATAEEYGRYFEFLNTVGEVLRGFGIHMGNNGYAYIMDAIKILIDRNTYDIRLKSDIYPLIAGKYRLHNQSTIEHSIRNAINSAYEDNVRTPGCNNMSIFAKRPTNKRFLLYVAESVQKSMCETMFRNAG